MVLGKARKIFMTSIWPCPTMLISDKNTADRGKRGVLNHHTSVLEATSAQSHYKSTKSQSPITNMAASCIFCKIIKGM